MRLYNRLDLHKRAKTATHLSLDVATKVENIFLNRLQSKRILVLTAHTNDPQMLEIQAKSLNKYLEFEFDFVAGIDLPPKDSRWNLAKGVNFDQFQRVADGNKIKLIEVPSLIHDNRSVIFPKGKSARNGPDFAMRCADSFQFMLGVIPWTPYSTVLYLDADMFPVVPIREIPTTYKNSVAGVKQTRKKLFKEFIYLWPGLVWFDTSAPMRNLLSFDLIQRFNLKTDVGGESNSWINALTTFGFGVKYLEHLQSGKWDETKVPSSVATNVNLVNWLKNDYRNFQGQFFSEIYDGKFLHYRGGGNWMFRDPYRELVNRRLLFEALEL